MWNSHQFKSISFFICGFIVGCCSFLRLFFVARSIRSDPVFENFNRTKNFFAAHEKVPWVMVNGGWWWASGIENYNSSLQLISCVGDKIQGSKAVFSFPVVPHSLLNGYLRSVLQCPNSKFHLIIQFFLFCSLFPVVIYHKPDKGKSL